MLLAQRAQQVIAIDNSDRMVELGSALAARQGVGALEYRKGDLEAVPIADGAVDLAIFSQSLHHAIHPERAMAEAWRILKPGGRIAILDLVQHRFAEAQGVLRRCVAGFQRSRVGVAVRQAWASAACTPRWCTKKPKPPSFKPCWRRERALSPRGLSRSARKAQTRSMGHPSSVVAARMTSICLQPLRDPQLRFSPLSNFAKRLRAVLSARLSQSFVGGLPGESPRRHVRSGRKQPSCGRSAGAG